MGRGKEQTEPNGDRKNFDTATISTPTAELGVSLQGGVVSRWRVKNPHTGEMQDILYRGKYPDRNGIPLLFPYFGSGERQGGPNHEHGAWGSTWREVTVEEEDPDKKLSMKMTHEDLPAAMREAFPHEFEATVTAGIGETDGGEDETLSYTMQVVNTGDEDMEISPGAHPFWDIKHGEKREIKGIHPDFDAHVINWDEKPPDTPYDFKGRAEVEMPDRIISIEDVTPVKPVITKLQVWADKFNPIYDHDYVCVEPITGEPIILKPGEEWKMHLRFSVRFKQAA